MQFEISPRHDIFLREVDQNQAYKITGSAARLAQKFAYHHCTLLYNVRLDNMRLLKPALSAHIRTKATPSVPAKCTNLTRFVKASKKSENNMMKLVEAVCQRFWLRNRNTWSLPHLFQYIPVDTVSDLEPSLSELHTWQHRFGHTPKFSIAVQIDGSLGVDLKVENGFIVDVHFQNCQESENFIQFKEIFSRFLPCRLDPEDLKRSICQLSSTNTNNNSYISSFFDFLNKHF